MFMGYPEGVNCYKLWCEDGKTSKYFISRDVILRETEYYMAKGDQLESSGSLMKIDARKRAKIEMEPIVPRVHKGRVKT